MSINLKHFCSTEEWQTYLHTPFSFGEFSYATNGHIAVRVARRADVPEADEKQTKPAETLVKAFAKAEKQRPLPISFKLPDQPEKIECEKCHGDGRPDHDCPTCECTCEECDGTGWTWPRQRIRFDGFDADAKYLRMIAALPEAKIALEKCQEWGTDPVYFTFAGGDGVLMTMNRDKILHEEEVFQAVELAKMDDEQITVWKWVEEETARIQRFAKRWNIESGKDPEMYPIEFERGEWDEQYRCYAE
jgi:hypothetical protein